ncbi:hypothetical protein RRG08_022371 [Elysia crispata]|uniref:Uncharacterized protein n=1 Tax=Elysia crispata TaxID=231223 RepID=A0AAE1D842_9GAST|nr:hypothetical protein RRG08_022371 [Elysia crispata]
MPSSPLACFGILRPYSGGFWRWFSGYTAGPHSTSGSQTMKLPPAAAVVEPGREVRLLYRRAQQKDAAPEKRFLIYCFCSGRAYREGDNKYSSCPLPARIVVYTVAKINVEPGESGSRSRRMFQKT